MGRGRVSSRNEEGKLGLRKRERRKGKKEGVGGTSVKRKGDESNMEEGGKKKRHRKGRVQTENKKICW